MSKFQSGSKHPRWRNNTTILNEIRKLDTGTLQILDEIEKRERSRKYCNVYCYVCDTTQWLLVDNLLAGKTRNCRCMRGKKYLDKDKADTLGQRYDAIRQRCDTGTHVSSPNYKGRGIKNNFSSREHFITWGLENFPHTDFKGLQFDRIDNDGHYSPDNLRLVSPTINARNKTRKRVVRHREKPLRNTRER